ncbi:MAG: amidohydrolase family protein, partial [Candidatus Humimicrobiaceae bacterium]
MEEDKKLYSEIKSAIDSIPIFDTHEHIVAEEDRRNLNLDFSLFFMMYAGTDLLTSGMTEEEFEDFQNPDTDIEKKWSYFEPHWPNIRNTSYSKVILEAVKDLYGYDDINEKNYIELSKKIKNTKNIKWYDQIIKEKSNIKKVLNHLDNVWQAQKKVLGMEEFRPVLNLEEIIGTCCLEDVIEWEKRFNANIYKLADLLKGIDGIFEKKDEIGYMGLKTAIAYMRPISFEETTFAEADKVFSGLFKLKSYGFLEKKDFLSKDELKPLQDYLIHYLIQKAIEYDMPVQIHTGIFELLRNDISNSNPNYLINLFIKYRKCNFDIFHAGYPYSDQLIAICKQFPNVYFDLCWIADISTHLYKEILNKLIEIIPSNKIFGFGGDYMFIEGLYGSQKLARKSISELMYEKIKQNYFNFDQAV